MLLLLPFLSPALTAAAEASEKMARGECLRCRGGNRGTHGSPSGAIQGKVTEGILQRRQGWSRGDLPRELERGTALARADEVLRHALSPGAPSLSPSVAVRILLRRLRCDSFCSCGEGTARSRAEEGTQEGCTVLSPVLGFGTSLLDCGRRFLACSMGTNHGILLLLRLMMMMMMMVFAEIVTAAGEARPSTV